MWIIRLPGKTKTWLYTMAKPLGFVAGTADKKIAVTLDDEEHAMILADQIDDAVHEPR